MKWKCASFCFILLTCFGACDSTKNTHSCIQQGDFQATLVETGELEAVNSRTIVMPWLGWQYGRPKLSYLIEEGSQVRTGDPVGLVDTTGIVRVLRDKENQIQIALADLKNLKVSQANQRNQNQGQITSAEAGFTLVKIQLAKMKFESEKKQAVSRLKYEKEQISLQKLKKQMKRLKIKQENEIKIQELRIAQLKNAIEGAQCALQKARLTASGNGLVEYKTNRRTREKVRAGDELWPGSLILGLPDLSQMKVKTTVNETDISRIQPGLPVIVRLDAFPQIKFKGEIIEIAKLCRRKDREIDTKVFNVVILLKDSDPILKPGMTVRCEIITDDLKDVFFVANECLIEADSRYYLKVKKGLSFQKKEVNIGPRNNEFTVIYGDFSAGQPVGNLISEGDD